MHSISISSTGHLQATTIDQPSPAGPINSVTRHEGVQGPPSSTRRGTLRTTAKEINFLWYRGFFGRVDVQCKSISLGNSKYRNSESKAISEEQIIRIQPLLLRKIFELRFMSSFGRISRTLTTYPVLEYGAPIFDICQSGDLQGLQVALSSGTVSPFVVDESGWSLLHVSLPK